MISIIVLFLCVSIRLILLLWRFEWEGEKSKKLLSSSSLIIDKDRVNSVLIRFGVKGDVIMVADRCDDYMVTAAGLVAILYVIISQLGVVFHVLRDTKQWPAIAWRIPNMYTNWNMMIMIIM